MQDLEQQMQNRFPDHNLTSLKSYSKDLLEEYKPEEFDNFCTYVQIHLGILRIAQKFSYFQHLQERKSMFACLRQKRSHESVCYSSSGPHRINVCDQL